MELKRNLSTILLATSLVGVSQQTKADDWGYDYCNELIGNKINAAEMAVESYNNGLFLLKNRNLSGAKKAFENVSEVYGSQMSYSTIYDNCSNHIAVSFSNFSENSDVVNSTLNSAFCYAKHNLPINDEIGKFSDRISRSMSSGSSIKPLETLALNLRNNLDEMDENCTLVNLDMNNYLNNYANKVFKRYETLKQVRNSVGDSSSNTSLNESTVRKTPKVSKPKIDYSACDLELNQARSYLDGYNVKFEEYVQRFKNGQFSNIYNIPDFEVPKFETNKSSQCDGYKKSELKTLDDKKGDLVYGYRCFRDFGQVGEIINQNIDENPKQTSRSFNSGGQLVIKSTELEGAQSVVDYMAEEGLKKNLAYCGNYPFMQDKFSSTLKDVIGFRDLAFSKIVDEKKEFVRNKAGNAFLDFLNSNNVSFGSGSSYPSIRLSEVKLKGDNNSYDPCMYGFKIDGNNKFVKINDGLRIDFKSTSFIQEGYFYQDSESPLIPGVAVGHQEITMPDVIDNKPVFSDFRSIEEFPESYNYLHLGFESLSVRNEFVALAKNLYNSCPSSWK